MVMSDYLKRVWDEAQGQNHRLILSLLEPARTVLDCGCDDGAFTVEVGCATSAELLSGIEIDPGRAALARARGVDALVGDLEARFEVEDGSVDAVVLNQVIEHLRDTDNLLAEVRRVLRPGGIMVISTENLSNWPNIISLALGWQPFSSTNMSSLQLGVGNPLAAHRGAPGAIPGMQHRRLFAPRGLAELVRLHGLEVEELRGAGYFPLSGRPAELFARLDYRHAAFTVLKARLRDSRAGGVTHG